MHILYFIAYLNYFLKVFFGVLFCCFRNESCKEIHKKLTRVENHHGFLSISAFSFVGYNSRMICFICMTLPG